MAEPWGVTEPFWFSDVFFQSKTWPNLGDAFILK
jgi:hypothetical protein